MADEQVAAVLEKFRLEYDELTELRRRVDARLAQLHAAITAITAAENREPLKFDGSLSDACRMVLKGATKPMAPTEVRDGVVAIGFQLSSLSHSNTMASIHSVLKRFVDSGDAESSTTPQGTRYLWTGRAQAEKTLNRYGEFATYGERFPEGYTTLSEILKSTFPDTVPPRSLADMLTSLRQSGAFTTQIGELFSPTANLKKETLDSLATKEKIRNKK